MRRLRFALIACAFAAGCVGASSPRRKPPPWGMFLISLGGEEGTESHVESLDVGQDNSFVVLWTRLPDNKKTIGLSRFDAHGRPLWDIDLAHRGCTHPSSVKFAPDWSLRIAARGGCVEAI